MPVNRMMLRRARSRGVFDSSFEVRSARLVSLAINAMISGLARSRGVYDSSVGENRVATAQFRVKPQPAG